MVLKEIPVPLWERESCDAALRTQFGPNYRIPDTALCAGAEGRDACDVSTGRDGWVREACRAGGVVSSLGGSSGRVKLVKRTGFNILHNVILF